MTEKQYVGGRSRLPRFISSPVRRLLRRAAVSKNVRLVDSTLRVGLGTVISPPHEMTIGSMVSVGPRSLIQANGHIGDFTLIASNVQIVCREDHAIDEVGVPTCLSTWSRDRLPTPRDSVTIGRDVWIGGGAIILSGVTIGEGSVIGAGSVVTGDIPDFSIAVGNPARIVSRRFQTDQERAEHSNKIAALAIELATRR